MVSHVVSQFIALFNLHKNKQFKSHPKSTVVTNLAHLQIMFRRMKPESKMVTAHESEVFSHCTQDRRTGVVPK